VGGRATLATVGCFKITFTVIIFVVSIFLSLLLCFCICCCVGVVLKLCCSCFVADDVVDIFLCVCVVLL